MRSLSVDVFPDEAGRQAHLEAGRASLMDEAPELFAGANAVFRHIRLQRSPLGPDRQEVNYKPASARADP